MNPLLKRLASLRLQVRFLDGWQGVCAVIALVLGVVVVVGVLDFFFHLPTLFRAGVLVGLLVGSGAIVYRFLVRPFSKPVDDLNLALRIEEAYPELNDALATTVQFLTQPKEDLARIGASPEMRKRTVAETEDKAAKCDFSRILDRKAAVLFGAAAFCALLIAGVVVGMQPRYSKIALTRLLEPFGGHTWTQVTVHRLKNNTSVKVEPYAQEKIAIKQAYHIKVDLTGQLPGKLDKAKIEIDGQIRTDSAESIIREDGAAYFVKRFDVTTQPQKFRYRILFNDGVFPARAGAWHEVEVKPEPKLVPLDNQPSPQITVYPPRYTDLPAEHRLHPGARDVQVFAGTKVVYRAKADRPLKEAWIAYQPMNAAVQPIGVFAAGLAMHNPWQVAASAVAEDAAWNRIPVKLEDDGSVLSANFTAWVDGRYTLYMADEYELEGKDEGNLHVTNDPVPEVKLMLPASSVTLQRNGKLSFKFSTTDEHFAVKSVYVEYRRKGKDGNWIDDVPLRNVLYEGKDFGALIPEMLARTAYVAPGSGRTHPKFPARAGDLRLRPKKLDFQTVWSLKNQFKEGELVEIFVCADDYCDLFGVREPGRSHVIELRIVSNREAANEADQKLGQIRNEVKRLAKIEQQALDTVKEMRAKDKVDAADIEKFIDSAETPQRALRAKVGATSKEGLRNDLKDLRQFLQDNNLENSPAFKEASEIKGTLDNIAQEELQRIEPELADARKDLAQSGKNTPKTKEQLAKAAKMQKNVVDSLNDLIQKADPNAKINDQKDQLREIIEKEKKILEDLQDLNTKKEELEKEFPDQKDLIQKQMLEKIASKAMEQREVAQQMEKLLKEMRAEQQNQEELGNKDNANKLKEALEKLEPKAEPMPKQPEKKNEPVNSQMKRVADDLKNKMEAPQQTLEKQKEILKELDDALNALEGKNEDRTKQDIKDRQNAEQKIDQLNKEIKQLRDEIKKAEMNPDKEEGLKKKEQLAKDLDKMVDKIEEMRRQVARLQEQGAANELNKAAEDADKARQKLENGENPDKELQQAKEDLDRAKEQLKDREEQLARELLIKIADQLVDIKGRQDAIVQRSEDFHPKIIREKSWSNDFLDTFESNMDVQKDIADETDTLREKLKGAKVFHGIMEGAKKSMDSAGETMKNRRELGKERRYMEKDKEERMDAKELEEENESQTETVRHQKLASKKLGHILDALKEEIAKKKPPRPKDEKPKEEGKDPKEPPKGMPAQDGIPPTAQLKALRSLQTDLLERTKEFHERNPDAAKLNDAQRRELRGLEGEQEQLGELFGGLVAPPPMPKEGELP